MLGCNKKNVLTGGRCGSSLSSFLDFGLIPNCNVPREGHIERRSHAGDNDTVICMRSSPLNFLDAIASGAFLGLKIVFLIFMTIGLAE